MGNGITNNFFSIKIIQSSMKKLSRKQREWLISRQKKIDRRRSSKREKKRKRIRINRPIFILKAPSVMCLRKNYEDVASFFNKFREQALTWKQSRQLCIDFEPIQTLSPDCALLLAAELDRWRRKRKIKLTPWKPNRWNPNVSKRFKEMGLFELLHISKSQKNYYNKDSRRFFKFITGNTSNGALADQLMVNMMPVIGSDYNESKLYIALSEAMTNVVQHAYPDDADFKYEVFKNQWWMSGSFDKETGDLIVLFFDQGVGIPATLPKQFFFGELLKIFKLNMTIISGDDATLINAALEYGRTKSKLPHRGKGLQQLIDFASYSDNGILRIISGKGEIIKNGKNAQIDSVGINHQRSIGGTFIEWVINIANYKV